MFRCIHTGPGVAPAAAVSAPAINKFRNTHCGEVFDAVWIGFRGSAAELQDRVVICLVTASAEGYYTSRVSFIPRILATTMGTDSISTLLASSP